MRPNHSPTFANLAASAAVDVPIVEAAVRARAASSPVN